MWVAWLFFSKPHPKPLQNKDKVLLKMKKTTQHRQRKKKKEDRYFRSRGVFTQQEDLSCGKQLRPGMGTLVFDLFFHSLPV